MCEIGLPQSFPAPSVPIAPIQEIQLTFRGEATAVVPDRRQIVAGSDDISAVGQWLANELGISYPEEACDPTTHYTS